jgi:hypothetical protein
MRRGNFIISTPQVHVFHDIGLDRLVNTYRNPLLLTRAVAYASCPGTRHVSAPAWCPSPLSFAPSRAVVARRAAVASRACGVLECGGPRRPLTGPPAPSSPRLRPQTLNMDNVTSSVLVGTGGVLTFSHLGMQARRPASSGGCHGAFGEGVLAGAFRLFQPRPSPPSGLEYGMTKRVPARLPDGSALLPHPFRPLVTGLQGGEHDPLALGHPAAAERLPGR